MSTTEATMTYREAVRAALGDAMRADETVLLLGEDVGAAGGVFKATEGLLEEYGPRRVTDTPIAETAIVGAALGLALAGYRPVAELMFADFAACAWDQIVNQAAKYCYLSDGQMRAPMVLRVVGGAGGRFGAQHSQTTESWYVAVPGLKVVAASSPGSAYRLLRAAIADPAPVVFIEHKALYSSEGPVARAGTDAGLGGAEVLRPGRDLTVVASLAMVARSLAAAQRLAAEGIEAEVIDVRSLCPLDEDAIVSSVQRTSRLLTVEEQPVHGGWGAQVVASVARRALDALDAPPVQLGLPWAPVPFSPPLEDAAVPDVERIVEACRRAARG